jgi:hypothetical protein
VDDERPMLVLERHALKAENVGRPARAATASTSWTASLPSPATNAESWVRT